MGIVLQGINQHVVGNHIQFLLVLALHIVAARFTDDACQIAQAHFVADGHARSSQSVHHINQAGINLMRGRMFL